MRILIDLQPCQSESRFRGIGRYSMSLALAIARNAGKHEVWILLNDRFPESIPAIRQIFSDLVPRQRTVVFSIPSKVSETHPHRLWLTRASEQIREFFIATLQPDIVHIFSLFEGWAEDVVTSVGSLPNTSLPTSVTLHDLIPLLKPEMYLPNEQLKDYYFRKIESLKNSNRLLAVSESSRREAIDSLDISPSKIVKVSAAADQSFQPQQLTDADQKEIFQRYGIQQPFLMYAPGGFDQRKNVQRLIQAYSQLDPEIRQQHQLLITGKLPPEMKSEILQCAHLQNLEPYELILTDYVSDFDLTALYSLCKLFVFPSIHEGFGLPALEAMSCGAAVIGSNISSIPEVIGRKDALFDPHSVEDICQAISHGLSDQQFRESLKHHALIQSAKFSWDNSAKVAIAAFEDLALETRQKAGRLEKSASQEQLYRSLIAGLSYISKRPREVDSDLVELATSIAINCSFEKKQLLVDISQLVMLDAKTGIQRVVRSVLGGFMRNPPSSYAVVPIYWDGTQYRQARQFISKLLPDFFGSIAGSIIDEIVDISCNDIFLGLDLTAHLAPNTRETLERFRSLGIDIYFVVYDILLIHHPEWWPRDSDVTFRRWLEIISELSTGLVCISQATANAIKDWLLYFPPQRADCLKIDYFHLGADIDQSIPSGGLPDNAESVLAALRSAPTVLMVGTVEPRKGHAQALNAFDLLWQNGIAVNLVIVGQHGWDVEVLAKQLDTHPELGQRLFWLKGISDEYLSEVYAISTVLLAASLGEGFGLPLIEAAQRHLPIIARDLPVFREVAGNYAFYFDGEQPEQLATAIEKWLTLYHEGDIPSSAEMPWLTWTESTEQLLKAILPELPKTHTIEEIMKSSSKLKVDIGGDKYILTSDDDYLQHIKNGFEPEMVKLFKTLATNSETILDIGANIGCTAILFSSLSKQVYAFEPSPTTFGFLKENIARSGKKNLFLQNMGLGAESSESTLTFSPSNRAGGFVSNQTQVSVGHTTEKIVIRQLDEVVKALNLRAVDFIKIDVEGFEGNVLRGAEQTLLSNKPVVVLELNHWCLNAFQRTSVPDFFDLLRSIFPILLAVDGSNYMNLYDENDCYTVMYNHILHMRFPNIVASFDEARISQFRLSYEHGFVVR